MDSLKVTTISTSLGFVYYTDIISGVLMCIMFAIQIYYLLLKAKKLKDSE
jgi:TRAP-type C4-dicarboxylate transport system permease small subunit